MRLILVARWGSSAYLFLIKCIDRMLRDENWDLCGLATMSGAAKVYNASGSWPKILHLGGKQ